MRFKPLSPAAIELDHDSQVIGRKVVCVKVTGSTNDWLRAAAAEGAPEGLAVFAEEQTAGRGQAGHRWTAPAGCCVLMSVLLRPTIAPDQLGSLTMLAACAAAAAAIETTGLPVQLKWPNDLMTQSGKVGGVLVESAIHADQVEHAIVGIGINVNQSRRDFAALPTATSLRADIGRMVDRTRLTRALLRALDERYALVRAGQSAAILAEWRERLGTLGKWVSVRAGDRVEGPFFATTVTDRGALILTRADGTTFDVVAGEVSVIAGPPGDAGNRLEHEGRET